MPNVKISDAADAGTLLASDMLPLARSGNTNAYHATMSEVAAFASTSLASGAYGNVGRNLCHNPLMNIAQRGGGPFTSGYTLDRWFPQTNVSTVSVTVPSLGDTDKAQIGDEAGHYCMTVAGTGTAGAADFIIGATQRIEDVRRLSGKTVTLSFWAKAASGTPRVGIELNQMFGSGGSPSAPVTGLGSQSFALTATWARFTTTPIVMPSIAGKTFGTTLGTDFTELRFWQSSGATNNAESGGIGVQSYTLQLWGVQLEVGSVATPLEKPDPRYDLANCERFFCLVPVHALATAAGANWYVSTTGKTSQTMRAVPTLTSVLTIGVDANVAAFVIDTATVSGFRAYAYSAAAGTISFDRLISCSADL